MTSASGLLARPPEEGARLLALSFLDQAVAARARLADPQDAEALHDFRVALRRLRSCLRAYRSHLKESVPKKLARRLKRLADATGPGRDTEVQIEWVGSQKSRLSPSHRAGLTWLLVRLTERMDGAYGDLKEEIAEGFPSLEEELRRRLSVYRTEIHLDPGTPQPTLGESTAEILRRLIEEMEDHLAGIGGAEDEEESHQARISAKRVRYLLEPFVEDLPGAGPLVKHFKGLQDLLGNLHDAHVLETDLAGFLETAAAERARRLLKLALAEPPDEALLRAERRRTSENGLIALALLNRDRRDSLFATLEAEWLNGKAEDFLREVEGVLSP
jgi:CHAD domain-containing protein